MINKPTVGIFSGSASISLSEEVAKILGLKLGNIDLGKFSDGEIKVEILENVRGHEAYIIQSTCAPTNSNLMELMLITDALKRSSASRITAILPYYGYARQDRRVRSARVPISAKVIADMMNSVGVDRVLTVDLHSESIQGFFDMPADNVYATKIMHDDIKSRSSKEEEILVVSPDVGGVVRARAIARRINANLAIIDKRREKAGSSEVMNIIGDVSEHHCILVDDIIDSGGTLCNAARALIDVGAISVDAYVTHGVLSGSAVSNISNSPLSTLVTTDSIKATEAVRMSNNIRQISIAPIIGEAIRRVHMEQSVSSLFE